MTFIKKTTKPDISVMYGCAYCSQDNQRRAINQTAQYSNAQIRCSNCSQ